MFHRSTDRVSELAGGWSGIAAVLMVLMAVALPARVEGQATTSQSALQLRAMVLGGASGGSAEGHRYGGVEGGLLYRRFGLMGIGQLGDGNNFSSQIIAGGPAIELLRTRALTVTVYGGMGRYDETERFGSARTASVGYAGLSGRIPVGPAAIGITGSAWSGRVDGDHIVNPFDIRAVRLSVGVGL